MAQFSHDRFLIWFQKPWLDVLGSATMVKDGTLLLDILAALEKDVTGCTVEAAVGAAGVTGWTWMRNLLDGWVRWILKGL